MGHVHVWFLCGVLSVLTERGKQDAQPLTAPEQLTVYRDVDVYDLGVNILNVEWKHGFTNSIRPDKVTYDIRIFYTQQMKLVHKETIELNANQMGDYKWSWKSQIPLQCTSHSVQLRYRDHDQTSAWTPLKTLNGSDTPDIQEAKLYPHNREVLVSEGIRFCCILKPEHNGELNSSVTFPIRISNQTYVTEPIRHSFPSPYSGLDVVCNNIGSTYYTGYPPDVHNITCETRDLHTVECRWNEEYIFRKTNYTVNGRNCTSAKFCVLTMTVGVTNWTLTAKNLLGQKTIFDTADPKHRVYLKAPELEPPASLTARNATLSWKWYTLLKDTSFSMICQVEVNGHIINGAFKVRNLSSVVLPDLQPFTQYVARVRCGSHDHFYKWGDWSNNITFITKEDIPEAVDVWMRVFNEQTYVVWNSLSAAQSHGKIIGYELVIGNSTERNKERINKSEEELCHNLQSGIAKTQVINISARNSAWVSPPSSITIPIMSGRDVDTSDIKGNNGSFDMVWKPSPKSTCGYVLDWYPTYQASQCAIKWIKVSSVVSSKTIYSDFIDGVKYTLSVYACTSGAPYLLQRREGYMVELPPLGTVQNLKAKQEGLNIYLSWANVPEQEQRGFIEGYKIIYQSVGGDKGNVTLDPNTIEHKFSLSVDKYTITVKAFTSAGDGPGTDLTLQMDPEVGLVIVVCLAVMMSVFCIITLLAYRNWKWLKSALWPEVPKPRLSEEFLKSVKDVYQWQVLDQLLYAESKVLKEKSSEHCPVLIVPELQKERYETLALTGPQSKGSSWSEDYQILKSDPHTCPLIDVDFAYQELPGIQNPTYNLPLINAVSSKNQESDYRPQTENCSIQQRPSNAYQWYHTPSNMPKLHFKDKFII